jgi:hypothetical protein
MNTIENYIKIMQIKIIGRVCIYCVLLLSVFSFVALKISMGYGLGLILVFLILLLCFTIPAYKTRLDLSKKFCHVIIKLASPLSSMLTSISQSNSNNEIVVNIYSFDSKFRLVINSPTSILKNIEDECNTISNKLSEILNEYEAKQNGRVYVNFDSLLVGVIALLLLDGHIDNVKVSLRISVQGYSEYFSFKGDEKRPVFREIKSSLIYQSL